MHLFEHTYIVLQILFMFYKLSNSWCPIPHKLHPCICLRSRSVLTCEDLYSEDDFKTITEVSRGFGIVGVEFESVAMRFIPEDAFVGLEMKFLSIKNSSIHALSETSRAFIGVEPFMESLKIDDSYFISEWNWSHLSNLTKLQSIEISDSIILEIRPEFQNLSHLPLSILKFVNTNIQWLPQDVFSNFKKLKQVALDKNELRSVNRTLFPRPAKKLESLGLGHNHIRFLPLDMFIDMPVLKYLYLGENPLHIMSEDIFKPVWNQLSTFVFSNNPLICDCRLKWITKVRNTGKFILATCITPPRLKGRKIATLEPDELWCQFYSKDNEMQLSVAIQKILE